MLPIKAAACACSGSKRGVGDFCEDKVGPTWSLSIFRQDQGKLEVQRPCLSFVSSRFLVRLTVEPDAIVVIAHTPGADRHTLEVKPVYVRLFDSSLRAIRSPARAQTCGVEIAEQPANSSKGNWTISTF